MCSPKIVKRVKMLSLNHFFFVSVDFYVYIQFFSKQTISISKVLNVEDQFFFKNRISINGENVKDIQLSSKMIKNEHSRQQSNLRRVPTTNQTSKAPKMKQKLQNQKTNTQSTRDNPKACKDPQTLTKHLKL